MQIWGGKSMKTTDTLPLYLDSQALEKGRKVDNLHMQ